MLTILGKPQGGFCDGISRRSFLKIGSLAMGGMGLPQILEAEARAGTGNSHKALIMIFLAGGPPHLDMWDLKPEAPAEIRGPFTPIPTNVPGIDICELFPRMATMADKLVFIRSLVGARDRHEPFQCYTGRTTDQQPPGGWPYIGAVLAKLRGPVDMAIPPAIGLSPKTKHEPWGDNGSAGFLGRAYSPFQPETGNVKDNLVLQGITLDRLQDRKSLLHSFDTFRRATDASGMMEGLDAHHANAFGILTSSRLAQAFDLSKEDPALRERYGTGSREFVDDGPWRRLDQFLLARRLVEAGARCVTLAFSRWDWHGKGFEQGQRDFPLLDQGVSALVADLHARGMDKDVSVVVWGEFGRTPKINNDGGRDHWPQVAGALMACGGMRTGQVIGATNRLGEYASQRPVHFQEVFATLYHNLGLDPHQNSVLDLSGRPRHLVDPDFYPMAELI